MLLTAGVVECLDESRLFEETLKREWNVLCRRALHTFGAASSEDRKKLFADTDSTLIAEQFKGMK